MALAIGLTIAALAYWRGYPRAATAIAGIGSLFFVATISSAKAARLLDGLFAGLARLVAAVLTFVFITTLFYLVVFPFSILGRLFGTPRLTKGFDATEASYWKQVAPDSALPGHTYMREPPRADAGSPKLMRWAGAAALLLVIDVTAGSFLRSHGFVARAFLANVDAISTKPPGWRGAEAWVDRYLYDVADAQASMQYEPFTVWKTRDRTSEFINVDDGKRATWRAPVDPSRRPTQIWMFGGSTMWGWGARDEHTIASELSRVLAEKGAYAEVTNFGEIGHNAWQSRLAFESLLAQGLKPDLAIFYDGVNDFLVQLSNSASAVPTHLNSNSVATALQDRGKLLPFVSLVELTSVLRAAFNSGTEVLGHMPIERDVAVYPPAIAKIYTANAGFTLDAAKRYEVPVLLFWQPIYYSRQPADVEEATFFESDKKIHEDNDKARTIYRTATALVRAGGNVEDISTAFDAAKGPVFIDLVHTNERGNRIVAEAMYPRIARVLAKSVEQQQ